MTGGTDSRRAPVAVIGMSGRFPRCPDLDRFWERIEAGERCIEDLPVPDRHPDRDQIVGAHGVLADADEFDPEFFGITAAEASKLDRQHRLFIDACWLALEDAAIDPTRHGAPSVSIYGACPPTPATPRRAGVALAAAYADMLAAQAEFMSTRTSYLLGLRGESMNVQTACSSSLVAFHLAVQSLLGGQSDIALVGGVAVEADQTSGYVYEESMIMSPDGHCRPFDREAAGTVPGSGVGVVALRRLADAERDGDPIRALVVGSALNNDGRQKLGFTAPSPQGQSEVIRAALASGEVDPRSVGYVETHGTATQLGDPVEFDALARVFKREGGEAASCALGAVKANIGHLDCAAGVAGVIKTVLCLERRTIPPLAEFSAPNPALDLEDSPFYFPREARPWEASEVRRAGVSSFGVGGTNAHVVLEEAV